MLRENQWSFVVGGAHEAAGVSLWRAERLQNTSSPSLPPSLTPSLPLSPLTPDLGDFAPSSRCVFLSWRRLWCEMVNVMDGRNADLKAFLGVCSNVCVCVCLFWCSDPYRALVRPWPGSHVWHVRRLMHERGENILKSLSTLQTQ